MKVSEILTMLPALDALTKADLPLLTSRRVARAMLALRPETELYEADRQKLFRKYGETKDGGMTFSVPHINGLAFGEEFAVLMGDECPVALPTVKLSELGEGSIKPAHLMALLDVVVIDDLPPETPAAPAPLAHEMPAQLSPDAPANPPSAPAPATPER